MGLTGGEETRRYKKGRAEVFDALVKATEPLKLKILEKDENRGNITAVKGLTFFSTGSRLSVEVKEEEGEVAVTVKAEPKKKITLVDYGESSKQARNLLNKAEEILGIAPEAGPGEEGESAPQAKNCPSCGKAVSESAKFCTGCGAKLVS